MLLTKITATIIVIWKMFFSTPRLAVCSSPEPPNPAPRLAPLVCTKIKMIISVALTIILISKISISILFYHDCP